MVDRVECVLTLACGVTSSLSISQDPLFELNIGLSYVVGGTEDFTFLPFVDSSPALCHPIGYQLSATNDGTITPVLGATLCATVLCRTITFDVGSIQIIIFYIWV